MMYLIELITTMTLVHNMEVTEGTFTEPLHNRLFQTTIKRRVPILLRVNQRKQPVLLKRVLLKRVPQRKVPQKKQRPKVHLQVQRGRLQDQRLPGHLQPGQQINRHHQDHRHQDLQVNRRHQDLQPILFKTILF